ncbi:MAG: immunity 49 family protein [Gemmataceae bacterium]|nr:immunity 49 family protein [Gemmataceae bacterium]
MDLQDVHAALVTEARENLAYMTATYQAAELGESFEKLSECFQALAICHLLETGDTEQFRENLVRSGHARKSFLSRSRREGNRRDRHLAISRTEAILDVLAAGHLPLAREIVQLSQDAWDPTAEYEDDFCYFRFLHLLVPAPQPWPEKALDEILGRFEQSLEGADSARLAVCKAVRSRGADDFRSALTELLEEKQAALDRKRPLITESGAFLFWPASFGSAEGLALLRVAELAGLRVEEEFPLCPEAARLPPTDKVYLDLFQEIDRELGRGGP